jgi:cell division protein FtsZ
MVARFAHPDANIIFGTQIDDTLGDEVRVTVIAAGFEGGEPKRVAMPVIDSAILSGKVNPIPENDPIAVAMEATSGDSSNGARRRVRFEELLADDEIDVPDFMK